RPSPPRSESATATTSSVSTATRIWGRCCEARRSRRFASASPRSRGRAEARPSAPAGRLAGGGGDLAGFHQLLETEQVLAHLQRRLLAQQPGRPRADLAQRRVVLEADVDLGAPAARRGPEVDAAGRADLGAFQRPPGDQVAGAIVDDLGVPLDAMAQR